MKWNLTIKLGDKVIFDDRFYSFEDAQSALLDEIIGLERNVANPLSIKIDPV